MRLRLVDLAADDRQLAPGDGARPVQLVGREHHGGPHGRSLADQVVDEVAGGGVESGVGLVEQPQLRPPGDEHGKGGAAALAGRQLGDGDVPQPSVDAETAERGLDGIEADARRPDGEAQVVDDRQLLVQEAAVTEQADRPTEPAAVPPEVVAEHLGLPLDHPEEAGAGAEERALAGSVGPGQVDDLPSLDEEVGTGEGGEPAEQDDGSGQSDGRRHGTRPWYGAASGNDQAASSLTGLMDVRRIVAGIGRTCIAAGMLILAFVAYQLWGTGLAESRSQDRLRSDFLDALQTPTSSTSSTSTVPGAEATTTTQSAAPPTPTGEAVAIIRIPKIDVEKAVVEGVGVNALKQGPGHYPTTPLPGQPGNAAIAGHRTTYGAPFYRTDELAPGDLIQVTTRQGEFTYKVRERKIVKPSQNEVLDPSDENLLTLTTCHPRFSAAQRLIIVAELTDNPAPAPPPPAVPPPAEEEPDVVGEEPGVEEDPVERPTLDEASVSGDDTAKLPAILWGLLAGFVWFVTWLLSKKWGRVPAYAMGTPVFLVVLFVFFENFARLLPANV